MKFSFPDFGVSSPNIPDKIKSCKMFAKASEQLCIYVAVWVADSAGHKRGQTSGNKAAGDLVHFFLGQLPGTHPAEYPIIIIRHKFLLSNLVPIKSGDFICRNFVDVCVADLGIHARIRIAGCACHSEAGVCIASASRNLFHFFLGQLTSAHPVEYPVIVFF
jgi:hypothetical protein